MNCLQRIVIVCTLVILATGVQAQQGIVGQQAPEWSVDQWLNVEHGQQAPEIHDYRGRVLYLYGFQSWCPGCHSRGFPTLQALIKHYGDDSKVAFVAIQTVFEGFGTNTFDRAAEVVEQYSLNIPVGHSGSQDNRSTVMRRYRTGGTPWTVIVDPLGNVRFNDFHIEPARAIRLIDALAADVTDLIPASRTGAFLLSQPFDFDGLENTDGTPAEFGSRGQVTLVRWWTHTCQWCEASLPALQSLQEEFAGADLEVVAVHHTKSKTGVIPEPVEAMARARGFTGKVVVDPNWQVLERNYLDRQGRTPTSVSFLLDRDGRVRYIHPGPEFRPAAQGGDADAARDYEEIRRAIQLLLAE